MDPRLPREHILVDGAAIVLGAGIGLGIGLIVLNNLAMGLLMAVALAALCSAVPELYRRKRE